MLALGRHRHWLMLRNLQGMTSKLWLVHQTESGEVRHWQMRTYDVISLRARPVGSQIGYRAVDEYESEFTLPQRTSRRPFSLRQLIRFLDSIQQVGSGDPSWDRFGFVLSFNQCNLECGADLEDLQNFTQVYSDQYPGLASHYSRKFAEWSAGHEQTDSTNQIQTMEELKTNERS
jgi:hypothetical protein